MRNQDVLLPEVVNILVIHWLPRNYGNVNKLRGNCKRRKRKVETENGNGKRKREMVVTAIRTQYKLSMPG